MCTAPATHRAAAATAATIRTATPSGSSVYCACHTTGSRGHCGDNPRRSSFRRLCVLRLPRKEQPRPLRRQSAPQLLQDTLCTAPATQQVAAATAATIRAAAYSGRSVSCACRTNSTLCTAPATQKRAAATAATIRAAAPSGSSVYCACHTKTSRGHCGDNPRRSSFRKLCVLRLPHKKQPRPLRRQSAPQLLQDTLCTAPATQQVAAATAATIRAAAYSGRSVSCACHTKSRRGHCGDNPRRSSFRKLCVLRLPHKNEPQPLRRQSAPQLLQEALCTAPATQKRAAATAATIRAAAPSGSSVYCACQATRLWDEVCEMSCVRWVVCEMSCVRWVVCEMSCVWDELCVRWVVWEMSCVRWVVCEMNCVRWVVWDELGEMSCVWDELCERWVVWEMSCGWDEWCEMSCVWWVVWDELCVRCDVWDEERAAEAADADADADAGGGMCKEENKNPTVMWGTKQRNVKSIDFRIFRTNWIPDFLPIGSLWLETSATALRGPYVIGNCWPAPNTKGIGDGAVGRWQNSARWALRCFL